MPSPGTPAGRESRGAAFDFTKASRPQSRLVAESASLGSAELADIHALLSQTAEPKPLLQQWQRAAASLKRDPRTDRPSIEHPGDSALTSSLQDVPQRASKLGMSSVEMNQSTQNVRELGNVATATRAESHRQLASRSPTLLLRNQSIGGEQMSDSARPSWQSAEKGERLAPQNRQLRKMLQSSYIDTAGLASLRTKWLQLARDFWHRAGISHKVTGSCDAP